MAIRSMRVRALSKFAGPTDRAIADARLQFAKTSGVSNWSLRADYETVEALPKRKRISAAAWTKSLMR